MHCMMALLVEVPMMACLASGGVDQHYVSVDFGFIVWLFALLLAFVLVPFLVMFIVRIKQGEHE